MPLPDGYYTITITDENYPDLIYSLNVLVSDHGTSDRIRLVTDFSEALVVAITDAFPEFIQNKRYREYLEGMPDYPNPVYEYCLIDINQDGVNEMILSIYESTMRSLRNIWCLHKMPGKLQRWMNSPPATGFVIRLCTKQLSIRIQDRLFIPAAIVLAHLTEKR